MSKFWSFKNLSATTAELTLYGDIRSEKPWWSEGDDAIYPRQFKKDLAEIGNVDEIVLRINSRGGDVFAATTIYSLLKDHPAKKTGKIDGMAASAAVTLLAACDTVMAPSNAQVMVHDPLLGLMGFYNAQDMIRMASVLEKTKESILNAYVNKTGMERQELADLMAKETFMTAEEAKEYGFVDEIMFEEKVDVSMTNDNRYFIVNSIAHDLADFKNRPQWSTKNEPPYIPLNVQPTPKAKKEDDPEMEIKNLEDLKKHFPDLCNQLVAGAAAEAVNAERDRLKGIDEIAATMPADIVNKAKYEAPVNAEQLALIALKADAAAGRTFMDQRRHELTPANQVPGATPPDGKPDADKEAVNALSEAFKKLQGGE
ncbi:head maturation protease, ClpP-related [Gorillibacterium sp. sgz5001074]|uniref:head maturation protease, ClpP-related n=1 Tax=Gorillibacterium sp. sgz5001074 TaxID=3446695 RepID=UPI003F67B946